MTDARQRLASSLTRLVATRIPVATRLVSRFLVVDDPYVREWVLLAAAGAAQHASTGDKALTELTRVVYSNIFGAKEVEPHVIIRHYVTEVCQQAQDKGVIPPDIAPESFCPPFSSRWPKIWTDAQYRQQEQSHGGRLKLFKSVEPGPEPGYGDWGRYVMAGRVHHFQSQRLCDAPNDEGYPYFDAHVAKRYVVQRVFDLGWDPKAGDIDPDLDYLSNRKTVERLSKKYQWIALYEFLGFLSDHYHFIDFWGHAQPFKSTRQLEMSAVLDPFVTEPPIERHVASWDFASPVEPWWRGQINPLPRPLSAARQREIATKRECFNPLRMIELNDGKSDWIALSGFHRWSEPIPVWQDTSSACHVVIEWEFQSYVVTESHVPRLVERLNQHGFENDSSMWLDQPEFGQPLSRLSNFPSKQEALRRRCLLDEIRETRNWRTGAWATTCRCAPDEEHRRINSGSIPSPQLAELGKLHWLGRDFDFGIAEQTEAVVRHVGSGSSDACIVQRTAMLDWIRDSGLCLVWRAFGNKDRHHESRDEYHRRDYWCVFILKQNEGFVSCGGATCNSAHGRGLDEPLLWGSH